MPYYRRRYRGRRRNYRRKPPMQSKLQRYLGYGLTAYRTANYLKTLINVERKYHAVTVSETPDATTGTVTYLSGLTQGDTSSQRDGNKVRVRSIQYHGKFVIHASASHTAIRAMIIRMKNSDGSTPVVSDVLENVSVNDYYKTNEIFNFKVLKDRTFTLSQDRPEVAFRWFIKQNSHLQYSGATNAVTDQQRNAYFLLLISDENTNTPTCGGRTRMQYIDN